MPGPQTYAQWSDLLDRLTSGADDAAACADVHAGTLDWTAGVAQCFAERVDACFDTRLRRCADRLARDLAGGSDETTLLRALLDTRRVLALLFQVSRAPAFPAQLKDHLQKQVRDYAQRTQTSLEDSARADRSGRIASLLRHNSLLRFDSPEAAAAPPATGATGPRRRILLTGAPTP